MKVWVVFDYSDYYGPYMSAICASEDAAKRWIAERQTTGKDYQIEEQDAIE